MVDRIADIWGTRTPFAQGARWPVRVDQVLARGVEESDVDRWVQSACVLCSNGCGVEIAVMDESADAGERPSDAPRPRGVQRSHVSSRSCAKRASRCSSAPTAASR